MIIEKFKACDICKDRKGIYSCALCSKDLCGGCTLRMNFGVSRAVQIEVCSACQDLLRKKSFVDKLEEQTLELNQKIISNMIEVAKKIRLEESI